MESNHRPSDYESPALTTAPRALKKRTTKDFGFRFPRVFGGGTLRGVESGRRDSNPRILAWKANALPLGDARVEHDSTVRDADGQANPDTEISGETWRGGSVTW